MSNTGAVDLNSMLRDSHQKLSLKKKNKPPVTPFCWNSNSKPPNLNNQFIHKLIFFVTKKFLRGSKVLFQPPSAPRVPGRP